MPRLLAGKCLDVGVIGWGREAATFVTPCAWPDHVVEKTLRFGVQLASVRSGDISRTVAGQDVSVNRELCGASHAKQRGASTGLQAQLQASQPAKC